MLMSDRNSTIYIKRNVLWQWSGGRNEVDVIPQSSSLHCNHNAAVQCSTVYVIISPNKTLKHTALRTLIKQ